MKLRFLFIAWVGALCLLGIQAVGNAEETKVGMTVSLTGKYAELGKEQYQGVKMWADDLNLRGALLGNKVVLVHYDDESDPETSARLYERLITEDRVDLLLGPYSSELTLPASSVAEKHSFPMLATGASSTKIWSRGFKNIFGVDLPANQYFNDIAAFAINENLERIAIIHADTEFAREVAKGLRNEAARFGLDIVFDQEYNKATNDFSTLVRRMARTNPDAVVGGTYLLDSIAFMRAAKAERLAPKIFAFTVGAGTRDFGDALGPAADGVTGVVQWMRSARIPMAFDFSYRYRWKYGQRPGVHAAIGYGAGQVLEAAVRLAGSLEKDKVREQLRTLKFRSLLGNYRVNETGQQIGKQMYVMQWQDGRRRLVWPENLAERELEFPLKSWSER